MLVLQSNLATTYESLGRVDEGLRMRRDVYSGTVRIHGEESEYTLQEAFNFAATLFDLKRHREVKALMRKMIPVARRVFGEGRDLTLRMQLINARALYADAATLDNVREALTTLEDTERTTRRVMGGAHPLVAEIGVALQEARSRRCEFKTHN